MSYAAGLSFRSMWNVAGAVLRRNEMSDSEHLTRHANLLRDNHFWAIFHRSPEGNDYYKTAMLDGPMNLSKFLIPDTFVSTGEASDRHGRRTDLGDADKWSHLWGKFWNTCYYI